MSEAPPEWKPERFLDHARIREIPRALLTHRRVLGIGYATIWVIFWIADFGWPQEVAAVLRLGGGTSRDSNPAHFLWARFVLFMLFFGSQLAFAWAVAGSANSTPSQIRRRRAVACGLNGLLATVCGLCVFLLLVTVTVPGNFRHLQHACAALLSGVGGAFAEWKKVPGSFFLLAAIIWGIATGASRWLIRVDDEETVAWRLIAMLLVECGLTLGIAVPLEVALARQHGGGPGTLLLLLPLLLWALGPSVYLLNLVSLRPRPRTSGSAATGAEAGAAAPGDQEFLDATEYVSLARSYSIVLLAALYPAIDGCRSQLDRTASLDEARQAWATLFVMERFPGTWNSNGEIRTNSMPAPSVGTVDITTVGASNLVARPAMIQGPPRQPDADKAPDYRLVVHRTDRKSWQATVSRRLEAPGTTNTVASPAAPQTDSDPRTRLRGAYQARWGDAPEGDDYNAWLGKVEYGRTEQAAPIPGLDLKFNAETVPWIFSLLVMGFVIQIRNQVRRALLDPTFGLEEPWLILDGQRGLERWLAIVWLLLVAGSPWIASGCLLAYLGTTHAAGALENPGLVIARTTFALPVLLVGAQISVTTCAEMLRLRRLRRTRLNAVREHLETEMVIRVP